MKEHIHALQSVIKADYGVQTPEIFDYLAVTGVSSFLVSGIFRYLFGSTALADFTFGLGVLLTLPDVLIKLVVGLLMNTRFNARDLIVRSIRWRGDEKVLDAGCGNGILTFACAHHLKSGKVIGIDIWDKNAGGGTPHLFWRNAEAEGVRDRVELQNVNAADMPYEDGGFDVVVSSMAIHHMGHNAEKAVQEMVRVLKPGGTIALFDVQRVLEVTEPLLRQQNIHITHQSGRWMRVLIGQKGGSPHHA